MRKPVSQNSGLIRMLSLRSGQDLESLPVRCEQGRQNGPQDHTYESKNCGDEGNACCNERNPPARRSQFLHSATAQPYCSIHECFNLVAFEWLTREQIPFCFRQGLSRFRRILDSIRRIKRPECVSPAQSCFQVRIAL